MSDKRADELQDKVEKLEKEVNRIKKDSESSGKLQNESEKSDSELSRRDFLKGALGGTAAAGAMAMFPSASALDFESSSGFSFGNKTKKTFELGSSGNLNLKGGDLQNAGAANVDKLSVGGDGPAEDFSEIGGASGVADAIVKLVDGMPTALHEDGTKISEDSDAASVIQDALNTGASSVGIGTGDFELKSEVKIPDNTYIYGAGMYGGTRLYVTTNDFGRRLSGTEPYPKNILVEGIHFDAQLNDRTLLKFGSKGGPQFVFARRCRVTNSGAKGGMHIRPNTDNDAHDFGFIECVAENCGGVSLDMGATAGTPHPKYGRALNNRVFNMNHGRSFTHGISVEGIDNCVVANNIVHQDPNNVTTDLAYNIN